MPFEQTGGTSGSDSSIHEDAMHPGSKGKSATPSRSSSTPFAQTGSIAGSS